MKKLKDTGLLAPLFLTLGAVAMVIRKWLFFYLEDDVSKLLPRFTLPEILLWVLTAAAIVLAFVSTRGTVLGHKGKIIPAVSSVLMGGGFASLVLESVTGPAAIVLVYRVLCGLAAVSMVISAFMIAVERKPPFVLELAPCIACVLHLLICYQLWSEVPQLMNYVLGLGAVLCLCLGSYFHMADAAGLPGKPWNNAVGLLGVYFCAGAIAQGKFSMFFTAAAIWLASVYAGITVPET